MSHFWTGLDEPFLLDKKIKLTSLSAEDPCHISDLF